MQRFITSGIAALALGAVACGPSEETREQLAQLQVVSAEKDSLLSIVTENTRLMSDIARELAKVTPGSERMAVAGESPYRLSHDSLLALVEHVTTRVQESEERLARSQRRISNLANVSDSLKAQIETYQTVVEDLHATIENQKETVVSLNAQLEQLRLENVQLAEAKAAVEDTLRTVEDEANTAYYIVGTKDELKEKGIVVEEGGSRFPLIFVKLGETLVPANQLDPTHFQPIDVRDTREIPLPDSTTTYRILSTQNLAAVENLVDGEKVRGSVRIANPRAFWSPSRFLIVVRG